MVEPQILLSLSLYLPCYPEPSRGDSTLHMADIKPPGQIRTVEVEVEPLPEDQEDDNGREEEGHEAAATSTSAQPEPTVVERDGEEEERPGEEAVATGGGGGEEGGGEEQSGPEQLPPQATPQTPPTSATTAATAAGVTQASPPPHTQPPPPPQGREAVKRPDSFGLDHPSPITRLPPLMSPADDMSGQRSPAGGKKKSKPKPLSNKDLMACHQDVARSNRELVEPSTPEFKPTTEWVRSVCLCVCTCTCMRVLYCVCTLCSTKCIIIYTIHKWMSVSEQNQASILTSLPPTQQTGP